MLPRYCQTSPRKSQRGATLIVGLVLLLVLTVVGVSGMNTATMEVAMAANTQFQQDAFQITEDAIDLAVAAQNLNTDPTTPTIINWVGGGAEYDRRAVATYIGKASPIPPGGAGASSGNRGTGNSYSAYHYDVQAVGRVPRNASAQHVQSFYIIGLTP